MPTFTTTGGTCIYYERHGARGPVLLMLHGLGSSTAIWEPQVDFFKSHCQVVLMDFPGHGQSEANGVYRIEAFAEIAQELLAHLQLERVYVMALSVGCSVALTLAYQAPERIAGLILEGPIGGIHPIQSPRAWPDALVMGTFPFLVYAMIFFLGFDKTSRLVNRFGVRRQQGLLKLEAMQRDVDLDVLRQLLWDSIAPPYLAHMAQVTVPLLVIRGEDDPMPERFVRFILEKAGSEVEYRVVPDTRHIVAMESPHAFNQAALAFLQKTEPALCQPVS